MLVESFAVKAVCKYHDGCDMQRSFRAGHCKGRPMGTLIRWLKVGKHLSRTAHRAAKTTLSQRKRIASRQYGASKDVLLDLFQREKGFNHETTEVCSEPSLGVASDSGSSVSS